MVIDFHFHLARKHELHPDVLAFCEKMWEPKGMSYADVIDGDVDGYLASQGVDLAVGLGEMSPVTTGVIDNDAVLDLCRRSKRLIPGANINPFLVRSPKEELIRLSEAGARVFKFYPTYQYFYPNDAMLYPLYGEAERRGLPVMFHTGSSVFRGARLKYGDPLFLDDVAVDFPELKILLVHGGRGFYYERAFFLAKLHKNVFLEISGLPPKNLLRYFPELERIADKVVFGSDWPSTGDVRNNIDGVLALGISPESKAKILGENAGKILNIQGGRP